MRLFWSENLAFGYADIPAAIRWWQQSFDAKMAPTPDWDSPPAAALMLPGLEDYAIAIYGDYRGFGGTTVPVIFAGNINKAHAHLEQHGVLAGPIQGDSPKYFEIRDCEGNVIEISEEP